MNMRANRDLFMVGISLLLFVSGAACSSSDDAEGGAAGAMAGSAGAGTGGGGSGGRNAGSGGQDSGSDGGGISVSTEPVDLGTAGDFVILAKTGISTVPVSEITGDIGVSPAAASYITGFSLSADPTNVFATTPQVVGKVFASDYEPPTPSNMTTAIGDVESAFSDAASRAPDVTELGAGDIGGMTLDPGVYAWGSGLSVPSDLTLSGDDTDVWIFQIAGNLTLSNGTMIALAGGAMARNVFWQVGGEVTVGTTAHLEGVVLSQTAITLGTGASVNGRLLAQTSVDLDGNTVVEPGR